MTRRFVIRGSTATVAALALIAAVGAGVLLANSGGNGPEGPGTGTPERGGSSEPEPTATASSGPGSPAPDRASRRIGSGRGGVKLLRVGRFDQPVFVTGAPGFGNLRFVVEQPGRVRVMRGNRLLRRPFLNLTGRVQSGGERGLLSVAFPPDYRQSKRFYVYYTDGTGDIRVDEFRRRSATRAVPNSRRSVLTVRHRENSNHNGGQLQFHGPLLYIGTGDGGGGGDPDGNAQNRDSLLGKLLRIDPRRSGGKAYSVPPTNPFVGRSGRDEIFSTGLRNPWRFSFDTVSAKQPRLVIADVGQNAFEEINYLKLNQARGANFGWNRREGFRPFEGGSAAGTTEPVFAYGRGGGCSITGGYVVGDRALRTLYGRYLFADFCQGELRSLAPRLGRVSSAPPVGLTVPNLSSFGQDNRGRIYVTSLSGDVYRLAPRR